jgi:adenylate cyclase
MPTTPQPRRKSLLLVCAVCTLLVAALYGIGFAPFLKLEFAASDILVRYGKKSPPRPEIVFLAIDQVSLALDTVSPEEIAASPALQIMQQSGWPWSRAVYPHIIRRLADAGAKVIAIDLMFPTPRDGDDAFRAALDKYRDKVIIGSSFVSAERGGGNSSTLAMPAPTLIPPTSPIDDRVAYVNFWPDTDEILRRAQYRVTASQVFGNAPEQGEEEYLSLAARILQKSGHADRIPAGTSAKMFRFTEQPGFVPHSVYEIFVDKFWKSPAYKNGEFFRDKIVLVGPEGNWSKDYLNTPLGSTLGPQLHLAAVNAALNNDFVSETSYATNLALIFLAGIIAWLLAAFLARPFLRLVIIIGASLGYFALALLLFDFFGIQSGGAHTSGLAVMLLGALLAFVGSGFTWLVWEQVLDRIEKAKMRRTLERYVSKDVVRELLDNPQSYLNSLGGVRKEISVLFSDVRGFTTLTESADPHALVAQLNEYFNKMVGIVFANHGTLDKFIGDAVMAHWGSIVSGGEKTDAQRAVQTALDMRHALAKLNEGWKLRGVMELKFGIGINHGHAIVGNLGCEEKMEVSVIGDAINLASRLEGVTKEYGIDLALGELAEPLVRDAFIVRSVDLLVVKGKTKPVGVFTVLDRRDTGAEPPWLALHEEAVVLYRAGDFSNAEKKWREVLAQAPQDSIAKVFAVRCAELQRNPPGAEWDGVFVMTKK